MSAESSQIKQRTIVEHLVAPASLGYHQQPALGVAAECTSGSSSYGLGDHRYFEAAQLLAQDFQITRSDGFGLL